ncbi:MAG: NUDIX hydrolase [Anaerolineae bacterium]
MSRDLTLDDVIGALRSALPGAAGQLRMGTRPHRLPADAPVAESPRQGAVLILLYPREGALHLALTRRTDRVANHKGQISLPGGAREPDDLTLWETALREAQEEIGLDPILVTRLGQLSPLYIPVSHFEIHPHVGYTMHRPSFTIDADEVAELIEMPLSVLLDPRNKREETWVLSGLQVQVPQYRYRDHVVWGATAMVLSELETLLAGHLDSSHTDEPMV